MRLAPAAGLLAVLSFTGCRTVTPATACIPTGSTAIAQVDLTRVRNSPVYAKLPEAVRGIVQGYPNARQVMAAWTGSELLLVYEGDFHQAPAGATMVSPGLAVSGPAEAVRAAMAQYRTGHTGAPDLMAYASRTVGSSAIWVATRGGVPLPLAGNAANLNRLLRNLQFAALGVDLDSAVDLRLKALGRDETAAREFEERVRAMLSMAAAGESRHPEIAALLDAVRIGRAGDTVTASVHISAEQVGAAMGAFTGQ